MSTFFYTSDLHFCHDLVADLRGFTSAQEHDEHLVDLWAQTVRPQDTVWMLGDLTGGRSREAELSTLARLRSLPGTKRLVAGNHDTVHPMHSPSRDADWVRQWIDTFASVQTLAMRKTNGMRLMLSHFPHDGPGGDHTETNRYVEWRPAKTDHWLVHGHTHLTDQFVHDKQVHVGFDAWGRFVPEADLVTLIRNAEVS